MKQEVIIGTLSYSQVNRVQPLAQEIPKPLATMSGRFEMKDLSWLSIFVFFFKAVANGYYCRSTVLKLVCLSFKCIQVMG